MKMPKLIDDWKGAIGRLWSLRILALDLFLHFCDNFVPFMQGMIPNWLFFVLLIAAMGARLIQQPAKSAS